MNKTIHYCWFGGKPKSKLIQKCIESWKYYFQDWEIKEWNEDTFDVSCNLYVQQAYHMKKWAFVSDYCRFWVLEKYGGLYFDTDVEVIKPFDQLLQQEAFAGFETESFVAPGLVLYAREQNNTIIREAREYYDQAQFLDENGERIRINVCSIFTNILKDHGFKPNGQYQVCDGMALYPKEYFCPFDDATGILKKTENTFTIHWYDKSWMSRRKVIRNKITRILHRLLGTDFKRKLLFKK